MNCPRLDHFVRLMPNGKLVRCGHMVRPPQFDTLEELDSSEWLKELKENDSWPQECIRCKQSEELKQPSLRTYALQFHKTQIKKDYLIVGGVLDNICNSACLFCDETYSTKIGSLKSKKYIKINNTKRFWGLPIDRIVQLDLNGGEPSASKNYMNVLKNLPPNVKSIRVNTNASMVISELETIQKQGIKITVTVSFDGVGEVYDYIRWPTKWTKFVDNLNEYKKMNLHDVNLWTTINALNIGNLDNIFQFVEENQLNHSYALLDSPTELNIKYTNKYTTEAKQQLKHPKSIIVLEKCAIDINNDKELAQFLIDQEKLRKTTKDSNEN